MPPWASTRLRRLALALLAVLAASLVATTGALAGAGAPGAGGAPHPQVIPPG